MNTDRPPSFGEEHDWNYWVLDNGLPDLPARIEVGEIVPIARWAGQRFGAVMHLWWNLPDEDDDEDYEPFLDTEVELFRRLPDGWEQATGSGGSDWGLDPPLARPDLPPRHAQLFGQTCAGGVSWYCCASEGFAGLEAATVEVADSDGVTKSPIESPIGVFLVAMDGTRGGVVTVRDGMGEVLMEEVVEGHQLAPGWDEPRA